VGGTEFDTRVDPAVLAAQPLPVEQMSPGEVRTPPGPCQSLDRLVIRALGTLTLAQERPAARLDSTAPVGAGRRRGRHHPLEGAGSDIGFAQVDRRLDQLSQCPGGELQLRRLLGHSLRRGERTVVAAKPVEEDCAHPLGPCHAEPLTACFGVTDRGLDQRQGVALTAERREQQLGIGCDVGPGRRGDRLGLGDRDGGSAEVAARRAEDSPVGQVDRQSGQRTGVASLLEVARADGMPAVLIPDKIGWVGSQPAPAEVLLG
jgi:hypothetical protein